MEENSVKIPYKEDGVYNGYMVVLHRSKEADYIEEILDSRCCETWKEAGERIRELNELKKEGTNGWSLTDHVYCMKATDILDKDVIDYLMEKHAASIGWVRADTVLNTKRRDNMDINTKYNEGKAAFTKVWEEFLDTQDVTNYRAALEQWRSTAGYKLAKECGCCVDTDKLTTEDREQYKKFKEARIIFSDSDARGELDVKRTLVKYLMVPNGDIYIPDSWHSNMKEILDFDVN